LIAFLLACMPAANACSFRALKAPSPQALSVPIWTVWILRFQLVVVYLYGAIAKLDPDWLRGEPMRTTLERAAAGDASPIPDFAVPVLAYAVAYLGLLADLAILACLLFSSNPLARPVAAVIFHGANAIALNIGVFSYLMLAMLPIFLEPDWPRRFLSARQTAAAKPRATQTWLLALLHLYVAAQILLPLRHWVYPGAVRWTEQGHRFAWRMMLRTKRSELILHVTDPATDRSWTINPANDVTSATAELETYPDLVLQYVHFQRDQLRRRRRRGDPRRLDARSTAGHRGRWRIRRSTLPG
jgi:hypothetical protein